MYFFKSWSDTLCIIIKSLVSGISKFGMLNIKMEMAMHRRNNSANIYCLIQGPRRLYSISGKDPIISLKSFIVEDLKLQFHEPVHFILKVPKEGKGFLCFIHH